MKAKEFVAAEAQVEEEAIDLRHYWHVVRRHLGSILGLAFIVTLIAVLVVFAMQPVYRATATLLIESNPAKVVSIEEVYGIDASQGKYYQTQYEILQSRTLAERVIDKLELALNPEFNTKEKPLVDWRRWLPFGLQTGEVAPSEAERRLQLASAFLDRLSIEPIRNTQLVKIHFEAHDAGLAATVANAVGDAYIELTLDARMQMTRSATAWLTERLSGMKQKLEDAERRLQAFRERERLVDIKGVLTLTAKNLDETTAKLVEARNHRAQAESLYRQVMALGKPAPEKLESIPQILKHPLVASLKVAEAQAESRLSELSKRYGPKHPKMIAAASELEAARASLRQRLRSIVAGIEKDYEAARANEAALTAALEQGKQEIQSIRRKESSLRELEREVDTNRQLYDTFFKRFQETSATRDLQQVNARIVDAAVVPNTPFKPNKRQLVLLALAVSLMLGVMLAFLLESLSNTFTSAADVEARLGLTMLGLLPQLPKGQSQGAMRAFLDEGRSGFAESIRTIRTGLMFANVDAPHKVLVVTSSIPGEGKTTLAMNLASALGKMERVLLVDADLRSPSIAKAFSLPDKMPGLSNLIAGTSELKDCVRHLDAEAIDVLGAGVVTPNPLELLSSQRFAKVVEALARHYDRVIIDSPPVQAVSDSLVLAKRASAILYVIRADATTIDVVKSGVARLRQIDADIAGAVLNRVDVKKARQYGGDYGYYDHYGYASRSG